MRSHSGCQKCCLLQNAWCQKCCLPQNAVWLCEEQVIMYWRQGPLFATRDNTVDGLKEHATCFQVLEDRITIRSTYQRPRFFFWKTGIQCGCHGHEYDSPQQNLVNLSLKQHREQFSLTLAQKDTLRGRGYLGQKTSSPTANLMQLWIRQRSCSPFLNPWVQVVSIARGWAPAIWFWWYPAAGGNRELSRSTLKRGWEPAISRWWCFMTTQE